MTLHERIQILGTALEVARAAMQAAFEREEVAYAVYNRAMHRADIHESPAQRRYDEAAEDSAAAQLNFKSIKREWEALTSNLETGEIEAQGAF